MNEINELGLLGKNTIWKVKQIRINSEINSTLKSH